MTISTHIPIKSCSQIDSASTSTPSYDNTTVLASQSRNVPTSKAVIVNSSTTGEETPLLASDIHEAQSPAWKAAMNEAKILVRYTAPTVCNMLLEYSFLVTTVVAIGHLSTEKLAGAALGQITASVTGLSILHGFACALDSVLPQAWTGGRPSHVGLWAQRMFVLLALVIVPIIVVWLNAERVFLHLRQEPIVAKYAAVYLQYSVPMLPAYAFNRIIRRYFQAQGLMNVPSNITIIVTPINIALNYFLVWGPKPVQLGFIGAPIATSISMFLMSYLYLTYGVFFTSHLAWHPISSKAFADLPKLFRLGLAGVGQMAAEWWAWEFISLAASQLGPTTLAAQSILVVSSSSASMVHMSLGLASAIRIGNLLGAGSARQAQIASKVAVILSVAQSLVLGLIFKSLRPRLAHFFNDDPAVAKLVSGIVPLLALNQILDGTATTTGGILRACGKISIGAASNFVGYYILGIPLGIYLAFVYDLGLFGLWIGLATALLIGAAVLYIVILRLDWDVEVQEAKARVETEVASAQPTDTVSDYT